MADRGPCGGCCSATAVTGGPKCLGAMFSGETQGLPALRLEGRGGEWGSPDTAAFAHLCDLLNCHLGPGPRKWIEIWDEEIVGTFSKLGFQDSPTGESCFLEQGLSCTGLRKGMLTSLARTGMRLVLESVCHCS